MGLAQGCCAIIYSDSALVAEGCQQGGLCSAHRCNDECNETKKGLLHRNIKKGGTARSLSANLAPPSALHKEKPEQSTPIHGREPSSACSLVCEVLAVSIDEKQGQSPRICLVLTSGNSVHRAGSVVYVLLTVYASE